MSKIRNSFCLWRHKRGARRPTCGNTSGSVYTAIKHLYDAIFNPLNFSCIWLLWRHNEEGSRFVSLHRARVYRCAGNGNKPRWKLASRMSSPLPRDSNCAVWNRGGKRPQGGGGVIRLTQLLLPPFLRTEPTEVLGKRGASRDRGSIITSQPPRRITFQNRQKLDNFTLSVTSQSRAF